MPPVTLGCLGPAASGQHPRGSPRAPHPHPHAAGLAKPRGPDTRHSQETPTDRPSPGSSCLPLPRVGGGVAPVLEASTSPAGERPASQRPGPCVQAWPPQSVGRQKQHLLSREPVSEILEVMTPLGAPGAPLSARLRVEAAAGHRRARAGRGHFGPHLPCCPSLGTLRGERLSQE